MNNATYSTYPGRTKRDIAFCLTCKWHSLLDTYVCCDYSLQDTHGLRGCRAGVGCDKWESGARQAAAVGKNGGRAKSSSVPYDPEAHKLLLQKVPRKEIAEIAGVVPGAIGNWLHRGRIKRSAALKIYDATGIDVTGGESTRGIKKGSDSSA